MVKTSFVEAGEKNDDIQLEGHKVVALRKELASYLTPPRSSLHSFFIILNKRDITHESEGEKNVNTELLKRKKNRNRTTRATIVLYSINNQVHQIFDFYQVTNTTNQKNQDI